MLKRLLRYFIYLLIFLIILTAGGLAYFYYLWEATAQNAVWDKNQASVSQYYRPIPALDSSKLSAPEAESLSFDLFQNPSREYQPWTRWWLPGNDLLTNELARELKVFAEAGFGGVEVQAFTCGLNKNASPAELNRRLGFDSPSYYQNIQFLVQEAQKNHLKVDLNVGSGWPSGGAHILPADGLQTLAYSESLISGGKTITVDLPKPQKPFAYAFFGLIELFLQGQMLDFFAEQAEIVAVYAAQDLENRRASWDWVTDDYVKLNPEKIQVITNQVVKRKLTWQAPAGNWRIITIYAMPSGESPILVAQKNAGFIVDHLDSSKVIAHYNYLLGKRTGLTAFYGNTIRAFFNDSFEFKTERHFSKGFLEYFQKKRGYDLKPYLPVVLYSGYDNFYLDIFQIKRQPEFILTENDARIRYDYSLTVSEMFIEQFLTVSNRWASAYQLQSRAQAYGMEIDVIKAAGMTQIPETEQLYAGGSEMFLKIASSGANLYNRNLVSAETAVFQNRDYMTTPQKLKCAVDKMLVSGVNHVIFHGTPYQIKNNSDYGEQLWHPFSSPFGNGQFSSDISETSPFWSTQKPINQYIARCQYLLRQGKPQYDVLIYYPFLGFSSSFGFAKNHQELLFNGDMPDNVLPPDAQTSLLGPLQNLVNMEENPRTAWLKEAWQIIQKLEKAGYTWQWVNDESLAEATFENGKIRIRGNEFKALVLPNAKTMQLKTVDNLLKMSDLGLPLIIGKASPSQQPGWANYQKNDILIQNHFQKIKTNSTTFATIEQFGQSKKTKPTFAPQSFDIIQFQRRLPGGELLIFLSNFNNQQVNLRPLNPSKSGDYYWLNPQTGSVVKLKTDEANQFDLSLAAYESGFLLLGKPAGFEASDLAIPTQKMPKIAKVIDLKDFSLLVLGKDVVGGKFETKQNALFDWRNNEKLKFSASKGIYTTYFNGWISHKNQNYVLKLEKVYDLATIRLNGKLIGDISVSPLTINLTSALLNGENKLEIIVSPALRNRFLGYAQQGDKRYKQFKGKTSALLPAGLVGKVQIEIWE
jgi:hypothetical protein